jgi:hypothetical protein
MRWETENCHDCPFAYADGEIDGANGAKCLHPYSNGHEHSLKTFKHTDPAWGKLFTDCPLKQTPITIHLKGTVWTRDIQDNPPL